MATGAATRQCGGTFTPGPSSSLQGLKHGFVLRLLLRQQTTSGRGRSGARRRRERLPPARAAARGDAAQLGAGLRARHRHDRGPGAFCGAARGPARPHRAFHRPAPAQASALVGGAVGTIGSVIARARVRRARDPSRRRRAAPGRGAARRPAHRPASQAIEAKKVKTLKSKQCPYCMGTGAITCARCLGSGVVMNAAGESAPCPMCNGQCVHSCENCKGRGRFIPTMLDARVSRDPESELEEIGLQ